MPIGFITAIAQRHTSERRKPFSGRGIEHAKANDGRAYFGRTGKAPKNAVAPLLARVRRAIAFGTCLSS
jgi:hypothetical protein